MSCVSRTACSAYPSAGGAGQKAWKGTTFVMVDSAGDPVDNQWWILFILGFFCIFSQIIHIATRFLIVESNTERQMYYYEVPEYSFEFLRSEPQAHWAKQMMDCLNILSKNYGFLPFTSPNTSHVFLHWSYSWVQLSWNINLSPEKELFLSLKMCLNFFSYSLNFIEFFKLMVICFALPDDFNWLY